MSLKSKKAENKTPMQNAQSRIRVAWIVAFISAAITLVAAFAGLMDVWVAFDALLVVVCAILLIVLKSRVASIILFAHFLFSSVMMVVNNPLDVAWNTGIFMRIAFLSAYFCGIMGTFAYHKLKKQESAQGHLDAGYAGAYYGNDPRFMPATPAIRQDTPGGKVILEHTHENLEIVVKRGSGVTELVVNGMVYAQETSTFDLNYELNVYVENALIKVHRDNLGTTYIYVNGNLVKSK